MAKSVNKVILLGNIGKDPDCKTLPSGGTVANFSLATSDRFKDKSGNQQEVTEWHNLTAYGKLAEIVQMYAKKGQKIYAEGKIKTRSWDKDGAKQYRTEIILSEISLLSGKGDGGDHAQLSGNSGGFTDANKGQAFDDDDGTGIPF